MPLNVLAEMAAIEKKYHNLKRKAGRLYASRDLKRLPALRAAIAATESELAALHDKVVVMAKAPHLRRSYSYDRFEEKLIKRGNRYER